MGSKAKVDKLQKIQNRFLRIVLNNWHNMMNKELHENLRLRCLKLFFETRYRIRLLSHMFKLREDRHIVTIPNIPTMQYLGVVLEVYPYQMTQLLA